MTRKELQNLTRIRLGEAKILLDNKNYNGAYYLAGYAIECVLKACISKQIKSNSIPDKKLINEIYTHNLNELFRLALIEDKREQEEITNTNFAANWNILKKWSESSRYKTFEKQEAKELYNSITSRTGGILKWLRQYW